MILEKYELTVGNKVEPIFVYLYDTHTALFSDGTYKRHFAFLGIQDYLNSVFICFGISDALFHCQTAVLGKQRSKHV
ncbi:hypothetical protein SDC9_211911 [bioreactor metagenome]|uniref:Uncharacterized protein n=1 Tax=bioreactor metagenome TaxID=1076179 RepID=A0A645JM07_9ZZZZ